MKYRISAKYHVACSDDPVIHYVEADSALDALDVAGINTKLYTDLIVANADNGRVIDIETNTEGEVLKEFTNVPWPYKITCPLQIEWSTVVRVWNLEDARQLAFQDISYAVRDIDSLPNVKVDYMSMPVSINLVG